MLLVTDLINVRWLTGFTGTNAAAVVGRDGRRRFVTDFRYLTQSAERGRPGAGSARSPSTCWPAWRRGCPAPASCASASTTPHMSVKDHGRLAGMLRRGIELVPRGRRWSRRCARSRTPTSSTAIRAAARLADEALTEVLGRGLVGPHRARRGARPRVHDAPPGRPGGVVPADRRRRRARRAAARRRRATSRSRPARCASSTGARSSTATRRTARAPTRPARSTARDGQVYALVLAGPGGRAGGGAPGPDGPRGRRGGARDHRRPPATPSTSATAWATASGSRSTRARGCPSRARRPLAAGMVVTVEPGVYVPGAVGVRIEDLVDRHRRRRRGRLRAAQGAAGHRHRSGPRRQRAGARPSSTRTSDGAQATPSPHTSGTAQAR